MVYALNLTLTCAFWAVRDQHRLRRRHLAAAGALPLPGTRVLSVLLDLPMSVSPVVVGLALVLAYSSGSGWFGGALETRRPLRSSAPRPGLVLATCLRQPPAGRSARSCRSLEEIGTDAELAAMQPRAPTAGRPSGGSRCPSIKWAVVYGVVLSLARSLGEFGAVKIVSRGEPVRPGETATIAHPEPATPTTRSRPPSPRAFVLVLASVLARRRGPARSARRSHCMSIEVKGVNKSLRRLRRPGERRRLHPDRQLTALLGPSRRRQVDPAAHHRRARLRRQRHRDHRGPRGHPPAAAEAQRGLRLPALRRLQAHDGGQERRLRPRDPQAPQGRDRREGRRAAQARAPLAVRPPAALAALGRPAPAAGAGPRARGRADGAAARRAVRRARREGPQGAARLAAPPARRGARDHRVRDPRPGGGPRGRRRDRGHQRGPRRADRLARPALRRAGQRLRDGLPRRGHRPRRGHPAPARHRGRHRRPVGQAAAPARSPGCCGSASRCGSPSRTGRRRERPGRPHPHPRPRPRAWPRAPRSGSARPPAPSPSPRARDAGSRSRTSRSPRVDLGRGASRPAAFRAAACRRNPSATRPGPANRTSGPENSSTVS